MNEYFDSSCERSGARPDHVLTLRLPNLYERGLVAWEKAQPSRPRIESDWGHLLFE